MSSLGSHILSPLLLSAWFVFESDSCLMKKPAAYFANGNLASSYHDGVSFLFVKNFFSENSNCARRQQSNEIILSIVDCVFIWSADNCRVSRLLLVIPTQILSDVLQLTLLAQLSFAASKFISVKCTWIELVPDRFDLKSRQGSQS